MVEHKNIDAFFERKVSDKDENCEASTSTLEKQPLDMFPSRVINKICSYLTPEQVADWGYASKNTLPADPLDQRDRISTLLPCLKGQILSMLPLKEAARTSILSRRWRYSWSVIPADIKIDDTSLTQAELVLLVDQVLDSRIGPVKTFILSDHCILGNFQMNSSYHLDTWILNLTRSSLEVFVFDILSPPENYLVPLHLQHCPTLRTLKLRLCLLQPSMDDDVTSFKNLVSLHLNNMTVTQRGFDAIIKGCRKLENLCLQEFRGFSKINLQAVYSLKFLEISGNFFNIDFRCGSQVKTMAIELLTEMNTRINSDGFSTFFICNPLIESLWINHFFLKYLVSWIVPSDVPRLNLLQSITLSVDFSALNEVKAVLCILRSSPNLKKLEICAVTPPLYYYMTSHDWENFFSKQPMCIGVKNVKLRDVSGSESELKFIEFLLIHAHVLKKMKIYIAWDIDAKNRKVFEAKLWNLSRTSGDAEILVKD